MHCEELFLVLISVARSKRFVWVYLLQVLDECQSRFFSDVASCMRALVQDTADAGKPESSLRPLKDLLAKLKDVSHPIPLCLPISDIVSLLMP